MAEIEIVQSPGNGQIDPEISEASVVNEDYDPSIPTDEKGLGAEITPSKMKVAELRSELMSRGLEVKGIKAVLVQRLEEALETTNEQNAEVVDDAEGGTEEKQETEDGVTAEGENDVKEVSEEVEEVSCDDQGVQEAMETGSADVEVVDELDSADVEIVEEADEKKSPVTESKEEKDEEMEAEVVMVTEDTPDVVEITNEKQEKEPTEEPMEQDVAVESQKAEPQKPSEVPSTGASDQETAKSQEETKPSTEETKPSTEETKPSTEETKPSQAEESKPKKLIPKPKAPVKPSTAKEQAAETPSKAPDTKAENSTPAGGDTKTTAAKAKAAGAAAKPKPKEDDVPPKELAKYWKAVKDKPTDFTGWTYLLQYVEQQSHMPSLRDAFDGFLGRYPYCYGYWKKYSDMERKKGKDVKRAKEVFETGLKAILLSSDLWMQYIQFVGQTTPAEEATDELRSVYTKAIAAAGTDFRSDKLWDMYINFEKDKKDWQRVTKIYDQLLTIPTQLYSHHFEKFKEHIKKHHPKDSLSVDEFIKLRMEVVEDLGVPESGLEDVEEVGDEAPPPGAEEDAPPGVDDSPPGLELPSAKPAVSSKQVEAENEAIRKKVIELRTVVYRQTEQEVSKRWAYEEGIRRPYFHAKPLEKSQLKNWREYLEFETTNGTHERVLILYERCLIACALYEEFWMRYAKYLEPHSTEGVSSVYKRACTIHLPKKPSIHLRWAAFEEKLGHHKATQEILQKLEENLPDLIMVTLERVSLERRIGNKEEVVQILKNRMEAHSKPEIKAFFAFKLSRYYMKVLNDITSARAILYEALEVAKNKADVYLQMLDLELQQLPVNESIVVDLLQKGLEACTDTEDKVRFSQRQLTYLMDFGTDVGRLQSAYETHQGVLREQLEALHIINKKRTSGTSEVVVSAEYQFPGAHVSPDTAVVAAGTPAKPVHKGTVFSGWKRGSDLCSVTGENTSTAKKAKTDTPATPTTPAASKPPPLLSIPTTAAVPAPVQAPTPAPAPVQTYTPGSDYSQPQQPAAGAGWGGYNQPQYGPPAGGYGPPPQGPAPVYNQPPQNYNQQYQQYQQAWGNYNQGYYPPR